MPSPFPPFAALALHQGNSRNLQLVGVGDDGALYLAAWQSHATGAWTVPDTNVLAFQSGTFSAVALASGNSDRLQVLGLGPTSRSTSPPGSTRMAHGSSRSRRMPVRWATRRAATRPWRPIAAPAI
ncbi:hypothetical protein QFZ27_004853 [Inquilinus ginsengisoli]|uniref:hypothetical protein n=1 Tax=Inquilinus ginsengisoli TaxID=363840 RepID=UPI003D23E621